MEDYKELRIEADTFDKLRRDADIVLQRALGTMAKFEEMYRVYGIKFEEEIDDERKNEELEKEKNYG